MKVIGLGDDHLSDALTIQTLSNLVMKGIEPKTLEEMSWTALPRREYEEERGERERYRQIDKQTEINRKEKQIF